MSDANQVARYIDELTRHQVTWVPKPAVLTFLGTTGTPGSYAAVGLGEVVSLTPGDAPTDMNVRLRGALPRRLLVGESVTVSISRYDHFHGYQIKTAPLREHGAESQALEAVAPGELVVHGRQAYTTHHGPYDLKFFERIPYEEVQSTVGDRKHAIVAMGLKANVSPRFVWYTEVRQGRLATYHGDGLIMKTFRNLTVNKAAVRLVFDLETLRGYALYGQCEEIAPDAHPEAYRRVCEGIDALKFGKPSRFFRHVSDRIEPVSLARA